MANNYIDLPVNGGGAAAGVNDINGIDGNISLLGQGAVNISSFGQNITISVLGSNNTFAGFNSSGELSSFNSFQLDGTSGGMNEFITVQPNNSNFQTVNYFSTNIDPLQNSPNAGYVSQTIQTNIDINSSGFSLGTNGEAVVLNNLYISHQGTSDTGRLVLTKNSFDIGNGTDPIDVRGFTYSYGFGTVHDNVTISESMQGYGYQPNLSSAVIVGSSGYTQAFYDYANIANDVPGYASYIASPNLGGIRPTNNYQGFIASPNVGTLMTSGNDGAGFVGLGVFPNITDIQTRSSFNGVQISPNITLNEGYAAGISVNMNNVTNSVGVQASLVVQDLTYTMNQPGTDGNNITVQYTNTTTAGNEVATLVSQQHIVVTIQSGVSTATQVRAAILANITLVSNITVVISGVASNSQVTYAQTNLAGGVNPGTVRAAEFIGDVRIQGALEFTGDLSIGALQSFGQLDLNTAVPGVNSISTLITQPTLASNTTVSGVDLLGINTAMLLTLGNNSHLTSSFLGYAALGLPAVVSLGTGSTIDKVSGATFAISLDASATGGTIDEVALCNALAIPNGVTAVTKLYGYKFELPFGNPATDAFGFYEAPGVNNYMAGNLKIGTSDTVSNANVALEIESSSKAFVLSRMSTASRNAMTPVTGMMLFNTTTNTLNYYNGSIWVSV